MTTKETAKPVEYTLTVERDPDPCNPREEFDHLGTIACWHKRYKLGDVQPSEEPQEYFEELEREGEVFLPLFMYDHSGITISTKPFSCSFDSGRIGIIHISKKDIAENWPGEDGEKMALACLKSEVEEYDQYLTGEVYGYNIKSVCPDCGQETETVGSCWGFYGEEYAKESGAEELKSLLA